MSDKSKSIIFMLASALSFTLMTVSIRYSGDLPIVEKLWFRNLVSLFITFWILRQGRFSLFGKPENRKFLILRAFLGITGMSLFFYTIEYLHLTDASILSKLSPFYVTLFATLFLGEKIKRYQIPALIIVFSAAMLVVKPKFDLSILPALAGFVGAAAAGGAYTLVRYLNKTEKPATIIFVFSIVSIIILTPPTLYFYQIPDLVQLLFLLLTGVFAASGQFGLTFAYRFSPATEVSFYSYFQILFAAAADFIFWGEVSDTYSIIGGVIIIMVSLFIFLKNRKTL